MRVSAALSTVNTPLARSLRQLVCVGSSCSLAARHSSARNVQDEDEDEDDDDDDDEEEEEEEDRGEEGERRLRKALLARVIKETTIKE